MRTLKIELPEAQKAFVDEQVRNRGFSNRSEYICELIRQDHARLQLRGLLLAGAASQPAAVADDAYFASLRGKIGGRPST